MSEAYQPTAEQVADLEADATTFLKIAAAAWMEAHPLGPDGNPWSHGQEFIDLAKRALSEAKPVQ